MSTFPRVGHCATRLITALVVGLAVNVATAADQTASSDIPNVFFDDTDNGAGVEWAIGTINSGDRFRFRDIGGVFNNEPVQFFTGCQDATLILKPDASNLGQVGIGTLNPGFPLHVFRSGDSTTYLAKFQQSRLNRPVGIVIENSAPVSLNNSCNIEFRVNDAASTKISGRMLSSLSTTTANAATGNLQFQTRENNGIVTAMSIRGSRVSVGTLQFTDLLRVLNARCNGMSWLDGSSRSLKQEIEPLSVEAAQAALANLSPVTYAYKDEPADSRVGFIAEDVPELVATPDRQTLSSLDIVAVLTKVTQEQDRQLQAQAEELTALQSRLAAIEALLASQAQAE